MSAAVDSELVVVRTVVEEPVSPRRRLISGLTIVATGVNQFASDLTSDGIGFTADFYQGGCHDWPFWQTAFTQSWPMLQSALGI